MPEYVMPDFPIRQLGELVEIALSPEQTLQLAPQDLFQLSEQSSTYLREHVDKFSAPVIKTVRKNGLEFNVIFTRWIDFWRRLENNTWEPLTFKIFDHFLNQSWSYLDIGAWIGPTVMYAAQLAKTAYAFEPDPIAFQELSLNLKSNDHAAWSQSIRIYQQAVAAQPGILRLGSRGQGGDSMSSALFSDEGTAWEVEKISLPEFFTQHHLQSGNVFVKMDIEGGEYDLLPHLHELFSQPNLVLYLSLHPWILAQSLRANTKSKWSGKDSVLSKLWHRLLFIYYHWQIFRTLPFKYLYHENGSRMSLAKQLFRALIFGNFATSLVATHKPWGNYDQATSKQEALDHCNL